MSAAARVLLFGGNGQVGFELARRLPALGALRVCTREDVDLTDAAALRARVRAASPDLIVNAAAWTAVDRAESDPATAAALNTVAPAVLAEEAARAGAALVHYSTDYVFDGACARAYREDDVPAPLGVYGRTKLQGERSVLAACPAALVFRTAWVYATRGANFLLTVRRLAARGGRLRIVDDQHGTPTWAGAVAAATVEVLDGADGAFADFAARHRGVYHMACAGRASWCDFARAVIEGDARSGAEVVPVDPIGTRDYPTPAPRPSNSVLDCAALRSTFGVSLPDWRVCLDGVLSGTEK